MTDCIFCKIVRGELPSFKIWEDEHSLAILDGKPNVLGMTLVLSKEHYDSYAFDMPDEAYTELMLAAKKVGGLLEKALGVHRVAEVMEGMGINHVHIKLYPLHGLEEKFKETWTSERVYFDHYQGYISTQLGPDATSEELRQLAEKIKNNI